MQYKQMYEEERRKNEDLLQRLENIEKKLSIFKPDEDDIRKR